MNNFNEMLEKFKRNFRFAVINKERQEIIGTFVLEINARVFFNTLQNKNEFIIYDDYNMKELETGINFVI